LCEVLLCEVLLCEGEVSCGMVMKKWYGEAMSVKVQWSDVG